MNADKPSILENKAAQDWFGLLEQQGPIAIIQSAVSVAELGSRGHTIPCETEQAFWAACEVIASAVGLTSSDLHPSQHAMISPLTKKIIGSPNLSIHVLRAIQSISRQETELEAYWRARGKIQAFDNMREELRNRVVEALSE